MSFLSPATSSIGKATSTASESMKHNISIDTQTRVTTNPFLSPDTPGGMTSLSKNRLSFGSALLSPSFVNNTTNVADSANAVASPFKVNASWPNNTSGSYNNSIRSSSVGRATSVTFTNATTATSQRQMRDIPKSMFSNTSSFPSSSSSSSVGIDGASMMGMRHRKVQSSANNIDARNIMNTNTSQGNIPLPPKTSMLDFSVSSKPTSILPSMTSGTSSTTYTAGNTSHAMTNNSPASIKSRPPPSLESVTSSFKTKSSVDYSTWVLVYGIPIQNPIVHQSVLTRFSSYGAIQCHFPASYHDDSSTSSAKIMTMEKNTYPPTLSSSTHFSSMMINWICIKYDTALEAEKALCQNGTMFTHPSSSYGPSPKMILGVLRVDMLLIHQLGLDIEKLVSSSSAVPWRNNDMHKSHDNYYSSILSKEEDILLLDKQSSQPRNISADNASLHNHRSYNICQKIMSWFYPKLVFQDQKEGKDK